jgi:hypothetical protein
VTCESLRRVRYDRLGKCLSSLVWLWAILSVKAMVDGVVRIFGGSEYVILSVQHLHWGILFGWVPLIFYLEDPLFLPPLTRMMRVCATCLVHMWVGLLLTFLVAGVWFR